MKSDTQPIVRKKKYRVTFDVVTHEGDVQAGTMWFNSVLDIPAKYFDKKNAKLWERSFDVFSRPTLQQMRAAAKSGNKYWLNDNEVIKEIK